MQKENKITAQKIYHEATRFWAHANKELHLANKNGKVYQDVKHLRVACGTAYLAVLKALDGIFLLRNIPKPVRRPSIEYYLKGLSKIDKKMLHALNTVYEIIHRCGYYGGYNEIFTIKHGFGEAQLIIQNLKQSI